MSADVGGDGGWRDRSRGQDAAASVEDEVRRAVRSEMRYYGREGAVRRADPFSVNPGQRVRGWSGEGDMHRKAVPL